MREWQEWLFTKKFDPITVIKMPSIIIIEFFSHVCGY